MSRIAKCQERGGSTRAEIRDLGRAKQVANRKAQVKERGYYCKTTSREETRAREIGFEEDSDVEECDASTNRLRYLQFYHGPRVDLLRAGGTVV